MYNQVLTGLQISAIANRSVPPHGVYGALFFNDFDQTKDGYSRQSFTSEPSVSAGSEQTSGTPWWARASRQYAYDAAGNPVKRLDANGNTLRYTYDVLNRLTRVQYPKGSDVTFAYDDAGRLKHVESRSKQNRIQHILSPEGR